MEKLQFEFTIILTADGKSNVYAITSITTEENETYEMPKELQLASLHTELTKHPTFTKEKNSINKRHQYRKFWITLTENLKEVYVDDGNIQFSDQYLQLMDQDIKMEEDSNTLAIILEKLVERKKNQDNYEQKKLKKIADKFVLEKFTSKTNNANQWIDVFGRECKRFKTNSDVNKIEVFEAVYG